MFFRFSFHFWQTVWHVKSIILGLIMLIVGGAVLISFVEQLPFDHALYFAFVTGLTIGYGDIVATTPVGRIISIVLGVIGIMFTGLVVAVAVRALQQAWKDVHGSD